MLNPYPEYEIIPGPDWEELFPDLRMSLTSLGIVSTLPQWPQGMHLLVHDAALEQTQLSLLLISFPSLSYAARVVMSRSLGMWRLRRKSTMGQMKWSVLHGRGSVVRSLARLDLAS